MPGVCILENSTHFRNELFVAGQWCNMGAICRWASETPVDDGREKVGHKDRRGQVLIEFVLILPLAITMLLVIVEFGFYLHRYIGIQAAVREGARAAVTTLLTDDQIREVVLAAAKGLSLRSDDIKIIHKPFDPELDSLQTGHEERVSLKDRFKSYQSIEVRIEASHSVFVPFLFQGKQLTRIVGSVRTLQVSP